jgi:hypothetical protein
VKPYGIPRDKDQAQPDVADIHRFAMKSSTGQFKRKGGDYRGHQKSKGRQLVRRIWKKKERQKAKNELKPFID